MKLTCFALVSFAHYPKTSSLILYAGYMVKTYYTKCRNPSLGLATKVRGCKVAGQERDLGVQRVWGNEPSHSQVNSNVGSWNPKWTPEFLECDFKGHNPLPWRNLYIIGKLLKCKCLKWARITHLDIWNTSYGQMKGWESNWQFDFQPLKVKNRPNFLTCEQCATYHWKALNEGYNFALDLITIGGLHIKLCTSKITGVLAMGISKFAGQKTICVATLLWPSVGVKPNTWKKWRFGVL
jgi:hypothetical protein